MTTTTPTPAPLRLEAGKSYRTEDGSKVTLHALDSNNAWPFTDGRGEFWSHGYGAAAHAFNGQCYGHRYGGKGPGKNIAAEWPEEDAPDSPVRTVTLQRTEIQPGTYGRIRVGSYDPERNWIDIYIDYIGFDATDLRAAAATLTQLADGLDAIASEQKGTTE